MSDSVSLLTESTPLICSKADQVDSSRRPVYTYAIVAAIGGFACGFDTGSISGVMALPTFQKRFFVHGSLEYYESILLAAYLVTSMLGAFFSGYFCDSIGRKNSMMLASCVLSLGISFELIGYNATTLLTGRLISGIGTGLMTNAIPLYQSEIAPPDIRGRMISMFSLLCSFGQMVGYLVTFGSSHFMSDWCWRTPWLMQLITCILLVISLSCLPYSPRWLLDKGKDKEGLQVLAKLHNLPQQSQVVQKDYLEIKTLIEAEKVSQKENRSYQELFVKRGGNLKRTLCSFFISIATCFTGNVTISYFAPQIFKNAGFSDVSISLALTGGIGLLSLVFTALSLGWWIDICGRKALFSIGSVISAISQFAMGLMFQFFLKSGGTISNIYAQYTLICCMYLCSASFAGTWGVANYVYTAEVFNMRCRSMGLSLTYAISWGCSIMITYCTPFFLAYSVSGVYFFFGSCSVITFILIAFIPETKGKSLEEIDFIFDSST